MIIEGIILSKTPYKERDLVLNVLEKSGKKVSIYCFGGAGGGKRQKNSLLDIGHCFKWVVSHKKGLFNSREWQLIWQYQNIRSEYKSFLIVCSFVQLIKLIAPEDIDDEDKSTRLYGLLASSLHTLEENVALDLSGKYKLIAVFMAKLIYLSGLNINTDQCIHSGAKFDGENVQLSIQEGGFFIVEKSTSNDNGLIQFLNPAYQTQVKLFNQLPEVRFEEICQLLQYFCYHQGLEPRNFILFDL